MSDMVIEFRYPVLNSSGNFTGEYVTVRGAIPPCALVLAQHIYLQAFNLAWSPEMTAATRDKLGGSETTQTVYSNSKTLATGGKVGVSHNGVGLPTVTGEGNGQSTTGVNTATTVEAQKTKADEIKVNTDNAKKVDDATQRIAKMFYTAKDSYGNTFRARIGTATAGQIVKLADARGVQAARDRAKEAVGNSEPIRH
jgi:hypothetical protein